MVLNDQVLEVDYDLVSLIYIFNHLAIILVAGVVDQERLVSLVKSKVKEIIVGSFSEIEI